MQIRVNILRKGDRVLSIDGQNIFIQRKNGEVDIIKLIQSADGLMRVDTDNKITIGFGNNTVEVINDNGCQCKTY